MNSDKDIKDLLTICIPTYNRKMHLKHTLDQFLSSPFKSCNIYVLNNASTDGTISLAEEYKSFPNIIFITNKYNIGGNANILRGVEYGETPYVWIIGDDDVYDFSYTDDVISEIKKGDIDLIHVGAHTEKEWKNGGSTLTPREALKQDYPYFKYSSFIGCSIYKREVLCENLIDGYRNIFNSYPHMAILLSFYENDNKFYISKNQIAKAVVGNQGYNTDNLVRWWCGTSYLLKNKEDRRTFFSDQFPGNRIENICRWKYKKQITKETAKYALDIFSVPEKITFRIYYPLYYLSKIIRPARKKNKTQKHP